MEQRVSDERPEDVYDKMIREAETAAYTRGQTETMAEFVRLCDDQTSAASGLPPFQEGWEACALSLAKQVSVWLRNPGLRPQPAEKAPERK